MDSIPVTLDKKDRRLLLELDRDARVSLTVLSRRLKTLIETLRYRIQRLISSGAIKNFLTIIDGGRLGYYYYKVFFRLHNVSEQIVQQIVRELCAEPRICWVIRVDGNYDLGFTPRVSNPAEQSALMDELRSRYANYLQRWTLSVNIKMDFFARDFLVGSASRKEMLGSYSAQKEPLELDDIGRRVLNALSADPRSSATAIAEQERVSKDTVLLRMRRLEREKVIVRYSLVTDTSALGQVSFYVLVYLNHVAAEREAEFVRCCAAEPNIVYLIKSLGEWDYELNVEAATVQDYRDLMMRLTRSFSDLIQEYNGMMVQRIYKYVYP